MLTLHVAPASAPCRAVLLALHQMGLEVPVEVRAVDLSVGEHRTPQFLALNPMHCVPTLETPRGSLWESRAILRYLCREHGNEPGGHAYTLYGADPWVRAHVDRLLDWDASQLYPAISAAVYPQVFAGRRATLATLAEMLGALGLLNDQLVDHDGFILGTDHPTLADLSLWASVLTTQLIARRSPEEGAGKPWFPLDPRGDDVPPTFSGIERWRARMTQLPGYAEVLAPFHQWREDLAKSGRNPDELAEAEVAPVTTPDPEPEGPPPLEAAE